jgi:sensor histidine kinase YesM
MSFPRYLSDRSIDLVSHKGAFLLTLRISMPFSIVMLLGFFYTEHAALSPVFTPIYIVVSNVLLYYLTFIIDFKVIQVNGYPKIKYFILAFGTIFGTVLLSVALSKLLFLVSPASKAFIERRTTWNLIKDLINLLIAHITILLYYISKKEQDSAIDYEKLIAENIRIRFEMLKNQVEPHFIFNSLNTLDGLIGINDAGAHDYLQNFSSVFRYLINNKDITRLSDELAFTVSYATMMKVRYGDNFRVEYHVDERYKTWFVMPISLQLLVENAAKHNVISRDYPLVIIIETIPGDIIRVKNIIKRKKEPEQSEGIGLANLTDRYKLLFQKEIVITQSDLFCVEIPLIENKELNNLK